MANHVQPINIMGVTYGVTEVRLTHAELSEAGLVEVVLLSDIISAAAFPVPVNATIVSAMLSIHTDFSGGAVATCVLELGDAGTDDELIPSEDIFTGAKAAQAVTDFPLATLAFEPAAYAPQITITTTTANVDQLDAGSCTVRIHWRAHDADSRL